MSAPAVTRARAAREAIVAGLKGLVDNGIRYYNLGDNIDPPGVLVALPALQWQSYDAEPTGARFYVYLVALPNDRAIDFLLDSYPAVVTAIESYRDATVIGADPAVWTVGNTDLPAYQITVEVALS